MEEPPDKAFFDCIVEIVPESEQEPVPEEELMPEPEPEEPPPVPKRVWVKPKPHLLKPQPIGYVQSRKHAKAEGVLPIDERLRPRKMRPKQGGRVAGGSTQEHIARRTIASTGQMALTQTKGRRIPRRPLPVRSVTLFRRPLLTPRVRPSGQPRSSPRLILAGPLASNGIERASATTHYSASQTVEKRVIDKEG